MRRNQEQGISMTRSVLFRLMSAGVFALFLGIFFFTPVGGVHAYRIYQQKRSGEMCAAWFCTNKATVSAFYSGDQGSGYMHYCKKHAGKLTPTKREGGGIFGLIAIAIFAFAGYRAFIAGFVNPVRNSLLLNICTIFLLLALANFSIWLFPMVFD
jgi:hypothetical protein